MSPELLKRLEEAVRGEGLGYRVGPPGRLCLVGDRLEDRITP